MAAVTADNTRYFKADREPHKSDAAFVFAIDQSGSVKSEWGQQKTFVQDLAAYFNTFLNAKYGLVEFGSEARTVFTLSPLNVLNTTLSSRNFDDNIANGTNIHDAFLEAHNTLLHDISSAPKNLFVILITDGDQTVDKPDPGVVVEPLKTLATVICIGVGKHISESKMTSWATSPRHYLNPSGFAELKTDMLNSLVPFKSDDIIVNYVLENTQNRPHTSVEPVTLIASIVNKSSKPGTFALTLKENEYYSMSTIKPVAVSAGQTHSPVEIKLQRPAGAQIVLKEPKLSFSISVVQDGTTTTTTTTTTAVITTTTSTSSSTSPTLLSITHIHFRTQFYAADFVTANSKKLNIFYLGPPGVGKSSFALGCLTQVSPDDHNVITVANAGQESTEHVTREFSEIQVLQTMNISPNFPFIFWDVWGISGKTTGSNTQSPYEILPLSYFLKGMVRKNLELDQVSEIELDKLEVNPEMIMDCVLVFMPVELLGVDLNSQEYQHYGIFFKTLKAQLGKCPAVFVLTKVDKDSTWNKPDFPGLPALEAAATAHFKCNPFYAHQNYSMQQERVPDIDWSTRKILYTVLKKAELCRAGREISLSASSVNVLVNESVTSTTVAPDKTLEDFVKSLYAIYQAKNNRFLKKLAKDGGIFLAKGENGWFQVSDIDLGEIAANFFAFKKITTVAVKPPQQEYNNGPKLLVKETGFVFDDE